MAKPVFLIGFMGSGKSAIGRALSALLGYEFIDLDEEIVAATGQPINALFDKFGEGHFREIEHQTLVSYSLVNSTVIATGGGAPCFHDNLKIMEAAGDTIFLDVPFDVAFSRISGSDRPLVKQGQEDLELLYKERLEVYRMAAIEVDAGSGTAQEIAEKIVRVLA